MGLETMGRRFLPTHALTANPVIGHLGWHGAPWVCSQE
jgi:hypothetical protein